MNMEIAIVIEKLHTVNALVKRSLVDEPEHEPLINMVESSNNNSIEKLTKIKKENVDMNKQFEERGSNLRKVATELSKIKTDMQLMESMAESFPKLSEIEESELEMHYFRAERYFETLFNKFQYLECTLDELQTRLYDEAER